MVQGASPTAQTDMPPWRAIVLRFADLKLDQIKRTCLRGRTGLNLTTKEFDLLLALLRRRDQTVSHATLAKVVWGKKLEVNANVIQVTIQRLRSKLDDPFDIKLLHTVHGAGYVLGDNLRASSWPHDAHPRHAS